MFGTGRVNLQGPQIRNCGSSEAIASQRHSAWRGWGLPRRLRRLAMTTVLSVPLVREQRPQAGVANMPGPGDALGAQHAFLSGAEPGDRRLAARVAFVDAEFDAARSEEHTSELQSPMSI